MIKPLSCRLGSTEVVLFGIVGATGAVGVSLGETGGVITGGVIVGAVGVVDGGIAPAGVGVVDIVPLGTIAPAGAIMPLDIIPPQPHSEE